MSDSEAGAANLWLDAWMEGQKQMLQAQSAWFAGMSPAENGDPMSDGIKRAQANWALCEKQVADWLKVTGRWMTPDAAAKVKEEGTAADTLRRMLDPSRFLYAGLDEINQAIQRLVEGPEFADIGTLERQVLKATSEWLALREASAAYRTVIAAAWTRAFETFSKEVGSDPKSWTQGPKAMLDRWLAVANDELIATQRTEAFLDAQRKLLRTGVDYRIKERALVEVWCETHSIPTRTEVDDLHKTVHELRRQVRELTKKLEAAGEAAVPAVTKEAAPPSVTKKATPARPARKPAPRTRKAAAPAAKKPAAAKAKPAPKRPARKTATAAKKPAAKRGGAS